MSFHIVIVQSSFVIRVGIKYIQIPKAAYRRSAVTRGAPRTSSLRLPVRGAFAYKGVDCGEVA